MRHIAALDPVLEQSGSLSGWSNTETGASEYATAWRNIWSEALRTHTIANMSQNTGSRLVYITLESVPVSTGHPGASTKELLAAIEVVFGRSATNLSRMLRVSRPMIYHYRNGMEPSAENKRRLQTLAGFMNDWGSQIDRSFEADLKTVQPEGRSLLDFLSDTELDFVALRRVIHRSLESKRRDRALRQLLADELTREETTESRRDIVGERHAAGKPVYVGDPDDPSKLIQLLSDGRRIRGRMVNREFVPDEK